MPQNRTLNLGYGSRLVALFLVLSLTLSSVSISIAATPPPEDEVFETNMLLPEEQSLPIDFIDARASSSPKLDSPLEAPRIRLAAGEFDPLVAPEPGGLPDLLRLPAYPGDGTGYYLLQFRGPIATSNVDALTAPPPARRLGQDPATGLLPHPTWMP